MLVTMLIFLFHTLTCTVPTVYICAACCWCKFCYRHIYTQSYSWVYCSLIEWSRSNPKACLCIAWLMHHFTISYELPHWSRESDLWQVNIWNVRDSGLDKSEIDRDLDDTVLTLVSGEDSDVSLSSSYSVDEIHRPRKGENESETKFSDCGKGWVAMWGEITLSKLNIDDGDNDCRWWGWWCTDDW